MGDCQSVFSKWQDREREQLAHEEQEHIKHERGSAEGGQQDGAASEQHEDQSASPTPREGGNHAEVDIGPLNPTIGEVDSTGKVPSAPPTTESNPSEAGSGTSGKLHPYIEVMARPKCSRVVLEDDEDEEEESVRPSQRITSGASLVTHKPACTSCAPRGETCQGQVGQTCTRCTRLKIKCSKSSRRSKVQRTDGDEVETDKKGKGKVPAHPTRTPRETASGSNDLIVLDDSDLEEEETLKKVPQVKVQPTVPTSGPVYEAGVRAVKRLEAKILSNQARIKACEADMADMSADVAGQSVELAAIKAALGM
ncbi:hypothetical protein JVT61DRAFT_14422 [Boletus reticuloceps]|uniref:Zn(2)-C6 fungal-type domain-containing protein n=1 Tax=Boletus reticuloceps TaxID=495285 RepID=A0A8I2YUL0_9AGAM|nr:hypothetical protein JVT61DRAFT_14422 [Boletus reticuloceps]